jgi:hypothetical protein
MVDYKKWDKLETELGDSSDEEQYNPLLEKQESKRCQLYSLCNDSYSGKMRC